MNNLNDIKDILRQGRATKKGRKAKVRRQKYNHKLEIYYTKELLEISNLCKVEGLSIIDELENMGGFIGDSAVGDAPWWITKIATKFAGIGGGVARISEVIARKVGFGQAKIVDDQLADQIEKMSGVNIKGIMKAGDLTDAVNKSIAANVSLIESIPKQYQQRLETIILSGMQEGKGYRFIKDEIKSLGQSTDARAELIARDQIGKLNSQFNRIRQQKLGIDKYRWSTSQDERVRGNPSGKYPRSKYNHYNRNNEIFSWDDPPPDGHAGEAVRCRCTPEPYLDEILDL